MPLFAKPQFNSVWAATGTKLTPDPAKISQGWVVEIPPHEYENWSQNRQDALLAHLNQVGIPMWDSTVEYQAGKSYVQGTASGTIYRAVNTNTNINPELDIQGNWVVAFEPQGAALLKSQNLADVPDKALARSNLGIPDTVFYDGRYLVKTQNFADVPNKASARTNLQVYSTQEVIDLLNTYSPAGEVAAFARPTVPPGWLHCDGTSVSRTTYARLFSVIGTYYGAGNGSTTFTLPDLRGEFIRGWDAGRGVDIGRNFSTFQADELKQHNHGGVPLRTNDTDRGVGPDSYFSLDTIGSTTFFGGAETRPRNVAMLYCIRT